MKKNETLMNEFQVEELESRFEMKVWIKYVICDDPTHCHNE